MFNPTPLVERACQIASMGKIGLTLRKQLRAEGYTAIEIELHFRSASLKGTLRRLAQNATPAKEQSA